MTYYDRVRPYIGLNVRVWDGRIVRITGYSVPGNVASVEVDGLLPRIGEVCVSFLHPENVVAND